MSMSRKEMARRFEEYERKQVEHIARHGRTCAGVFALADSKDPTNETFVYTIGNALKGLPELLTVGLCDDHGILNALSEVMILLDRSFDDGDVYTFKETGMPVALVEAAESVKETFTRQATHLLGGADKYRVMQVVLSDKAGLFPWQPGCAAPYSKVKVHRAKPLN